MATRRVTELDGIRGLAILLVLVWHCIALPLRNADKSWPTWLTPLSLTWCGVDLFFVLSGFLICGILLDNASSDRYLTTFFGRRFYRIVPVYAAVVAIFLLGKAALGATPRCGWLFANSFNPAYYVTFTQNLAMARAGGFGAIFIGPTWSVAVEEQFYLVLPLLVRYVPHRALPWVFVPPILLAPILRHYAHFGGYVLMPCRADALLLGGLIAWAERSKGWTKRLISAKSVLVASLTVSFGVIVAMRICRPGWTGNGSLVHTPLAFMFGALLLLGKGETPVLTPLLRMRWLRWIGGVSYCVYLVHLGIFGMLHGLVRGTEPHIDDVQTAAVSAAALIVTFVIAHASFKWFEGPLISRGHRLGY